MRSASVLPALIGLAICAGPVLAEPATGWVDPPSKSGTAAPVEPAKPQPAPAPRDETAARSEPATPAAGAAAEAPPPRRARTVERRRARQEAPVSEVATREVRASGWAGTAQRLTSDYLDTVSAPGAQMVSATPRIYADRVVFHGRAMTRLALAAEKSRFVQRWPERRYEPRGGMRTACAARDATCTVQTIFQYRAGNPARGLQAQGTGELTLTVSFAGERPVIVAETSRVLRRGAPVLGVAAETGGNG